MQKLLQTAAAIVMVFFCSTAFSQTARPFGIADFKIATWK